MSDVQRIGTVPGSVGSPSPFTAGITGASRMAEVHGRYLDAVLAGRGYFLSVAAAAPTAYVGAAGGTPLIGVHNPPNSGITLVACLVGCALRVGGSAAGNTGLAAWSGPSVLPTGTRSNPVNARSLAAAGSGAAAFVNTAMTGSTALGLALPLLEYQVIGATPVGIMMAQTLFDVCGFLVADPGNQIAIGFSTIPTSMTADAALFWEEIPYLPFK